MTRGWETVQISWLYWRTHSDADGWNSGGWGEGGGGGGVRVWAFLTQGLTQTMSNMLVVLTWWWYGFSLSTLMFSTRWDGVGVTVFLICALKKRIQNNSIIFCYVYDAPKYSLWTRLLLPLEEYCRRQFRRPESTDYMTLDSWSLCFVITENKNRKRFEFAGSFFYNKIKYIKPNIQ